MSKSTLGRLHAAVRDVDHSRRIGYPVWSSSVSPITGLALKDWIKL